MSARILIPNDRFKPRWYQRPVIAHYTANGHDGRRKRGAWVLHRRGGKDLTAMEILDTCAWRRVGMYWHTFPTFEQGRKAIWEGFTKDGDRIIDFVFPPEQIRGRDNQQMKIELRNGSIYRIVGTDKIESVGAGPVGVIHSEYSIAKPRARDMIAPMLRENDGWELCVYTPRGNNHGKKLFDRARDLAKQEPDRWFCDLKTLPDTKAYDPERTLAEERAEGKPEALIRQEYLCDWTAANVGAVFGDLIEALEKGGRVCAFEPEKGRAFTTWDLGGAGAKGDATAFWLWAARDDGAVFLDYYEGQGKTLDHYMDEADRRAEAAGVRVVRHYLPHDSRAKHLTGATVVESCVHRWGMEAVGIYPQDSFLNGLAAARWLLQRNVWFHPRCVEGLEALKAYHYEWDEDRKTFSSQPMHDWSSHGADAFRGVALVARAATEMTRPDDPPDIQPFAVPADGSFTMDELWQAREQERRWER